MCALAYGHLGEPKASSPSRICTCLSGLRPVAAKPERRPFTIDMALDINPPALVSPHRIARCSGAARTEFVWTYWCGVLLSSGFQKCPAYG